MEEDEDDDVKVTMIKSYNESVFSGINQIHKMRIMHLFKAGMKPAVTCFSVE